MKATLLIVLLLSIVYYISCVTENKIEIKTGGSDIQCRKFLASTEFRADFWAESFKFGGAAANVLQAELWSCDQDTNFAVADAASCGDKLPNSDKCQLIFSTDTTTTYSFPSTVAMKFGKTAYEKLVLVVRPNGGAYGDDVGITLEGISVANTTTVEAGVISLGFENENVRVPSNGEFTASATYNIKSFCENDCATVNTWTIDAVQPIASSGLGSISLEFIDGGFKNGTTDFSYTTGAIQTTKLTNPIRSGPNDYFSVSCSFTTNAATRTGGDNSTDNTQERCKAYGLYYPRLNGASSCMKGSKCVAAGSNPNFQTNLILNYVMLLLTGIIIGIILGIAITMIVTFVLRWFSNNSFRFQKKYFASLDFFKPNWWFKSQEEIEPEDEEEENPLMGLKNENDAAAPQGDLIAETLEGSTTTPAATKSEASLDEKHETNDQGTQEIESVVAVDASDDVKDGDDQPDVPMIATNV